MDLTTQLSILPAETLSEEYRPEDVWIGHSYFMASDEEELKNKIEYEVLPLIAEYINDGILNVSSEEKDSAFSAWLNLQPMPTNEEGLTYTEDNG